MQLSPTNRAALAEGVIALSTGDVRVPVYPGPQASSPCAADQPYPHPAGAEDLREAISGYHEDATAVRAARDRVLVAPGARLALWAVLRAVPAGRTRVLVPTPSWPSYPAIVTAAGGLVEPVEAPARSGRIDLSRLLAAVSPDTAAVIVNSPRNPDGAVIGPDDLRDLVALTDRHGALLIADEVYRGVPAPGAGSVSLVTVAAGLPAHCAVVDGLTKSHALAGLRIGWALAGDDVGAPALAALSHLVGGVSATAQRAAVRALAATSVSTEELRRRLAANQQVALDGLDGIAGVRVTRPPAGIFLFPDLTGWLADAGWAGAAGEAHSWLRDTHGVAVVDGAAFGAPGHVRLCYAVEEDQLREGIARLGTALRQGAAR